MKVKFNGEESDLVALIGGGPQDTLLGQLEYLVLSNDNAYMISPSDRYKYVDDLTILQLICLSGLHQEFVFTEQVASDLGVGQLYLPADAYQTQSHLDKITQWSQENLVKMNEEKSNYMIFSRTKEPFSTRLTLNNYKLDQVSATKLLGVWITEDLLEEKYSGNLQESLYQNDNAHQTQICGGGWCTVNIYQVQISHFEKGKG